MIIRDHLIQARVLKMRKVGLLKWKYFPTVEEREDWSHSHTTAGCYFSSLQDGKRATSGKWRVHIQRSLALLIQLCLMLWGALRITSLLLKHTPKTNKQKNPTWLAFLLSSFHSGLLRSFPPSAVISTCCACGCHMVSPCLVCTPTLSWKLFLLLQPSSLTVLSNSAPPPFPSLPLPSALLHLLPESGT